MSSRSNTVSFGRIYQNMTERSKLKVPEEVQVYLKVFLKVRETNKAVLVRLKLVKRYGLFA